MPPTSDRNAPDATRHKRLSRGKRTEEVCSVTCPKCNRAMPDVAVCPHCGADAWEQDRPSRNKRGGWEWKSELVLFGTLAVMLVAWLVFPDAKIGAKSLVFWLGAAGWCWSRKFR